MKNIYYNNTAKEQETIINIDYCKAIVHIYTSRKNTCEKLKRILKEPKEIIKTQGEISGMKWEIPFSDSRVSKILIKKNTIGNIKRIIQDRS